VAKNKTNKKRTYGEFTASQNDDETEFGKMTNTPKVEKKRKVGKGEAEITKKADESAAKKSFLKDRKKSA